MAQSLEYAPFKGMLRDEIVALKWRKSTRSIGNGQCIEAARLSDGRLAMRDSQDTCGPIISVTQRGWHSFVNGIKDGEFDSL
jgi:hypothetical protein